VSTNAVAGTSQNVGFTEAVQNVHTSQEMIAADQSQAIQSQLLQTLAAPLKFVERKLSSRNAGSVLKHLSQEQSMNQSISPDKHDPTPKNISADQKRKQDGQQLSLNKKHKEVIDRYLKLKESNMQGQAGQDHKTAAQDHVEKTSLVTETQRSVVEPVKPEV
jgi:hypothetical protein